MLSYNRLTIDFSAIEANLKALKSDNHIMAIVKGNGYGAGAVDLAKGLANKGISFFGVAHITEAISLRENNIDKNILIFSALPEECATILHYDLQVAVSNRAFCSLLNQEALKAGKPARVHLDICTGMHRLGCKPEEALELAQTIHALPGLILEGIMTQFVASDRDAFDSFSQEQIASFQHTLTQIQRAGIKPQWIHAANSGGARRFSLPFCNMIRIGLNLFQPHTALTLESCIISINTCKKGNSVGYLRTYTAHRDHERIAVLPIGYHDGIPLAASGKGYVLIHGQKAPLVGLICMDFMMVDITNIPSAQIGERALIFGKELPPQNIAQAAQTNVRTILSSLGPRVERLYLHTQLQPSTLTSRL